MIFRPQPGPQEQFLASTADIAIYGGAAMGGKTYALLLESLRGISCNEYHGVIFRRHRTAIENSGGLLDEARTIYYPFGAHLNKSSFKWSFKDNVDITFAGLSTEDKVLCYQGAQNDFTGFDELTHFTEYQFWYMWSRARSKSGEMKAYVRASCNPEPGWVADLISWWIGDDGFPIHERSGILRWAVRENNSILWFDTYIDARSHIEENYDEEDAEKISPISITFIPANIEDNQVGIQNNPQYISTLNALPEVEKQRLLYGNWKIKPEGKLFKAVDFKNFAIKPSKTDAVIITVDTAQETKTANDFTVMQVWCRANGNIYLLKQARGKWEFNEQLLVLKNLCITEKPTFVCIEKKSNGSALIQSLRREVSVPIRAIERNKDKYTRGFECQQYVESGYVYLNPSLDYYTSFINEIVSFSPENKNKSIHDDQVDCMMDAIDNLLVNWVDRKKDEPSEKVFHNRGMINGRRTSFQGT